jgi:hypothetical protein
MSVIELPVEAAVETPIDFDELLRQTRPTRPKLSAAIRDGATHTEPVEYEWFVERQGYPFACALGAACYVAAGYQPPDVSGLDEASRYFPELTNLVRIDLELVPELSELPKINRQNYQAKIWLLGHLITTLNDVLNLNRNRIADIVEALGY